MSAPDENPAPPDETPAPMSALPAPSPASPPTDRWAHRRTEPRGLAFLWTCYLLAATAISIGQLGRIGLTTYEVYRPSARLLLTFVLLGVAVFWPMVRLSQEAPGRPIRSFLADAVVVLSPGAAIILSQSLPGMAGWPLEVTLMITLFAVAWSALVCGVLGFAMTSTLPRWCWMVGMVALAAAGPGIAALLALGGEEGDVNPFLLTSPLTVTFEVTRDRLWAGVTAEVLPSHWAALAAVSGLGVTALSAGAIRTSRVAPVRSVA